MQGVANKLFAAEGSIDKAMADSAALMGGMVAFREEQMVSAVVGDPCFAKVAAAMSALSAARTAMVEAHASLEESKLRLGVRTKMSGSYGKDRQRLLRHGHPRTSRSASVG